MLKLPSFGEENYTLHQANARCRVCRIPEVEASVFDAYVEAAMQEGFVKREGRKSALQLYAALQNEGQGLFLTYFSQTRELFLALEEECHYFEYEDPILPPRVTPQITQVMLEDFGMSYVIRLSDGRFIVIDGGHDFEPHRDSLLQTLLDASPDEKPVIAAWILSHPHSDHFHCMIGFMDAYAERVKVEKFMLLFPEADDFAHYPKLATMDARIGDTSGVTNIPLMWKQIQKSGAAVYTPHTGQRYLIGDATCEILACMEDTLHCSQNINASSLVIRMELGGQVILWATDASFEWARLPERYGAYLKADILQVPHHGFQSGNPKSEIKGYDLIAPRVCFLPVSDYNAYTVFCTYRPSANYLMQMDCVEEIITGTPQRTVNLPYQPPASAKRELEKKYREGRANGGAHTWIFSGLSTACQEDLCFSVLNMANRVATVWIELFFEDRERNLRFIKAEIPAERLRRLNIVGEDVDGDALYFNWMSLKERGLPEDAPFAARFMSDIPVVISHPKHQASYYRV